MDQKKLKRNACEGCYKSRVKCEYATVDSVCCTRCTRQKRECVPRIVLRGKANKLDKDGNAVDNLNAVDLEAYRSASLFEDVPHLTLHYHAAASLVKTYKSLGIAKAPTGLRWLINSLYLIAVYEKSLSLLHSSTTLAVATKVNLDVALLNEKRFPFQSSVKTKLETEINTKYLYEKICGPCFILRLDMGERAVVANQEYEYFFEDAVSMATRMKRAPHFKLWKEFVVDKPVADKFITSIVKSWLLNAEPRVVVEGEPERVEWDCTAEEPTEIQDNKGNIFSATLVEHGVMIADGYVSFLIIGFKDMKPASEGARQRMEEFKKTQSSVPDNENQHGLPQMARFDSAFPMFLPPMEQPEGGLEMGGASFDEESVNSNEKNIVDSNDVWNALDITVDGMGGLNGGEWNR
uniref:Uncharacterized protein n=1 Tax=Mucochytrium quahogii TaxID=96639 RepID=A0A7S2WQ29_9STRA|mmetsp:Transcript_7141/g.11355  ORF Transcript_7141/g.11355 Transcript_7141/m.11355 type:complete len:407 (+) Transcript_7141:134-1354(+)